MKWIKTEAIREGLTYRYTVDDMHNVEFKFCSLGKYKGKSFLVTSDGLVRETRILDSETGGITHSVIIPKGIEYSEEILKYNDVFYDYARKFNFAIEDGEVFNGYTYNEHWNGWDVPYGTKEVVEKIIDVFELEDIHYDSENDQYFCKMQDEDEQECFAEGIGICNTEDGFKHLYRLGNGWVWDEV